MKNTNKNIDREKMSSICMDIAMRKLKSSGVKNAELVYDKDDMKEYKESYKENGEK